MKEGAKENVEKVVMNIFDKKLEAGITERDISRTHRIERKQNDKGKKPRPIIVRFASYRQRKQVFDKKKKLKGEGILITESLTKKRYSLLNKCFDAFCKGKVWTLDGRIHCIINDNLKVFTNEDEFVNFKSD